MPADNKFDFDAFQEHYESFGLTPNEAAGVAVLVTRNESRSGEFPPDRLLIMRECADAWLQTVNQREAQKSTKH